MIEILHSLSEHVSAKKCPKSLDLRRLALTGVSGKQKQIGDHMDFGNTLYLECDMRITIEPLKKN